MTSNLPKSLGFAICFGLLLALLPASAEPKPDGTALTLQTLEDFRSAEQTVARKPIKDAEMSYRSMLEKFQKTAQVAGNLKSVLAAKQAITELDANRPPLVSDDAEVAAIQKTYTAQRQKADAESEKALAKVDQDYLASLKKLVAELTKAGNIDQAVAVQAKVDGLAALAPKPEAVTNTSEAQGIEFWKKKALEEFPALKRPDSELARSVKALKEKKETTTPSFLKNPQWPYLLAKEASLPPLPLDGSRQAAIQKKLKEIVIPRVDFEDTTVFEAIDFMRLRSAELDKDEIVASQQGLNFVITLPPHLIPPRLKRLRVRDIPAGTLVQQIALDAGMKVSIKEYFVELIPVGAVEAPELKATMGEAAEAAAKIIITRTDFDNCRLDQAATFLNDRIKELAQAKNAPVIVLDASAEQGAIIREFRARNVSLLALISYIASTTNHQVAFEGKKLHITKQ